MKDRDNRILKDEEEIRHLSDEIESGKGTYYGWPRRRCSSSGRRQEIWPSGIPQKRGDLSRKLASLSEHLEATSASLKEAEESLAVVLHKEKPMPSPLLAETTERKEQAEKAVRELTRECEQVHVDLDAEKERVPVPSRRTWIS